MNQKVGVITLVIDIRPHKRFASLIVIFEECLRPLVQVPSERELILDECHVELSEHSRLFSSTFHFGVQLVVDRVVRTFR